MKPPLAAFLSHVHSDHLQGLESLKSPFIYCAPATRELLLRLETYPHRMNFSKGILESRKQHYKHLKSILKTIPLNAPADIELSRGNSIRVTLLDANHCAGAVMFLIQKDTRAVLYTGDIRSEPWWVSNLSRNPILIPFTHGQKRLDKIYLDTTFATNHNLCRNFPTKAVGLEELLNKVAEYPENTVFHFHAWTLGYEDVWIALSSALRTQIHVDEYRYRLYKSLASETLGQNSSHEGAALFGFTCGNRQQHGCLTDDQTVRVHSCEYGMGCPVSSSPDTVYITPIITRSGDGEVLNEMGAGGSGGDLVHAHSLDLSNTQATMELVKLCSDNIENREARTKTLAMITRAMESGVKTMSLNPLRLGENSKPMPLAELARRLGELGGSGDPLSSNQLILDDSPPKPASGLQQNDLRSSRALPRYIKFPYSRHSSYEELCNLVNLFKPTDVYPCTVNEESWTDEVSIEKLFGLFCAGTVFAHDQEMSSLHRLHTKPRTPKRSREPADSQDRADSTQSLQQPSNELETFHQISSNADAAHGVATGPYRLSKHIRNGYDEEDLSVSRDTTLPISKPFSRRKLSEIRKSFDKPFLHIKRQQGLGKPVEFRRSHTLTGTSSPRASVSEPTSDRKEETLSAVLEPSRDDQEYLEVLSPTNQINDDQGMATQKPFAARQPLHGSQTERIGLNDADGSNFGHGDGSEADGCFLLEDLPEPDHVSGQERNSQVDSDTQLTLSDSAFDTESLYDIDVDKQAAKLQHRKDAYRAVREVNGLWQSDFYCVSSGANHGIEELEL